MRQRAAPSLGVDDPSGRRRLEGCELGGGRSRKVAADRELRGFGHDGLLVWRAGRSAFPSVEHMRGGEVGKSGRRSPTATGISPLMRAISLASMPSILEATIVSAPRGSTCTISASNLASVSEAAPLALTVSGRMPNVTARRAQGHQRSAGSTSDAPIFRQRPSLAIGNDRRQQVHRRIAEEARHEGIGRVAVDLERRCRSAPPCRRS